MIRDPNATLSLAKFFAPALYRPVDVTGWTPEELEDLADNDAWAEAARADDLARWEARRLAVFFGQSRDWRPSSVEAASRALSREGQDVAATLNDDPLRGDPDCPTVRRLVALLHRPRDHAAAFFAGADRGRAEGERHDVDERQSVIAAAIRAGDRPGRDDSRDYRTPTALGGSR